MTDELAATTHPPQSAIPDQEDHQSTVRFEIEDLTRRMTRIAEEVLDTRIALSETDSPLGLSFVARKLSEVSTKLDGLSGLQTKVEIFKIRLMEIADGLRACSEELERLTVPPEENAHRSEALRQISNNQRACDRALRVQKSVAYAIAGRIGVVNRCESTLHLHHKMWQAGRVQGLVPQYDHVPDPERDRFDVTPMDNDSDTSRDQRRRGNE